jgi:hypothetical protein
MLNLNYLGKCKTALKSFQQIKQYLNNENISLEYALKLINEKTITALKSSLQTWRVEA